MYICPVCAKEFEDEDVMVKHYLFCWKQAHPYHKSKPAPRSEDINTCEANDDVLDFFKEFR